MGQVITIKLKLYNPTKVKREMYKTMADRTTDFANRYLGMDASMDFDGCERFQLSYL